MASVQASPGKENLSGAVDLLKHKPIDTTIEIKQEPKGQNIVLIVKQEPVDSELIAEPLTEDDLGKNMRWIMERAEKFEGNEPAGMFDALGAAGPVVRALNKNLSIAYTLLKENDMQVANGTVNPIAGLQKAYSITSAAERLVKTTSAMLKKITVACTVTATFEELAAPLADFVDYLAKLKDHKFSTNDLIELVCQLLKKMQDSSSGPHDSSLLSATERLFIACFNSPKSKLRTGAVSMWNKTFGNSKDLVYSDKLRQVLVVISKRASIFLPGLSVELKAEKSNASTPHKIRLTTKRPVAALVEEDSVDYHVPAQKTDLTKKMKLTDHQKECFSATREKMPYMDEDSSQFKTNVLQRIGSQYDVDTSSQSASTSAIQKVAASTQATEAVFKSPVKKESPVKIEISNVSKEPEEKKNEEKPKKRRGRPPKNSGKAEEKSPESSNSTDGKRRSARRNLALSPAEKKKDADENSAEIVTPSSDSTFESSDNSQDASSVAGGRSRRSQNKGTPSKFVPKVRYSRDRATSTVKSKSPSTKKAEPSPAKDSERNNNADAYLKTETDEEDNETLSEIIAKSQKKMPSKTPTNSDEDPSTASSSIRELPPVENSLLTPAKNNQSEEKVDPPITTPGILKRAGTPSTLDKKKMRVHFTQDVALREEERNAAVTTPKRGSKKIDAFLLRNTPTSAPPAPVSTSSHAAVFPTLANDTEPITKILDQLTPVKTSTSAAVLRKSLTLKNITTVGDLAATSESGLRGLPIKLDRVKCVLQKYAQIVSKEMPPVEEEKKVEAPPVTIAPTPQILSSPSAVSRAVHDDDSMETEELKTIEFSPGKVVEKKKEKDVGIDEEQSLKENKEPEAARVETKMNVEEREKIAGSQDQMLSMLSSLTQNSSLVGQMNLGRDQVKELLTAVNSLQTCLLQKL